MGNPPSQLVNDPYRTQTLMALCVCTPFGTFAPAVPWGCYRQACAKVLEIQTSTDALLAHVLAALDECDDGA